MTETATGTAWTSSSRSREVMMTSSGGSSCAITAPVVATIDAELPLGGEGGEPARGWARAADDSIPAAVMAKTSVLRAELCIPYGPVCVSARLPRRRRASAARAALRENELHAGLLIPLNLYRVNILNTRA